MYGKVSVSRRSLEEHRPHVGDEVIDQLRVLAAPLRGSRVLNLSVSPFGTSVSDLLHSLVPLLNDLGVVADWQVVGCDEEFGHVARLMYAGLRGSRIEWTPDTEKKWRRQTEIAARSFEGPYDVVLIHDPQPAGLPAALAEGGSTAGLTRWAWQCHLDLRGAQAEVWNSFQWALRHFDAWVLQHSTFAPATPLVPSPWVIPPAIDPTGARNMRLPQESVRQFCDRYGLDPNRPLAVQVGAFDSTFDPIGAVDVYRRAKRERPDLQLLLTHLVPEASWDAWSRFERLARYVGSDPDARVLVGQGDGGQMVVNVAQRAASVVLQRAVPAGFALPVWEAQWKARPVVVGAAGGLPLQVEDGVSGYVASDDDALLDRLLGLLSDQDDAARLGAAGRMLVQEHHLMTRLLADELRLLGALLSQAQPDATKEELHHAQSNGLEVDESGNPVRHAVAEASRRPTVVCRG